MRIIPILLFLTIVVFLVSPLAFSLTSSSLAVSYPMGISFYSLFSTYFTNMVMGVVNITSMSIGSSYLPNGQYLTSGNASLQLNAIINGVYWAQDVILFHQVTNNKFEATLVLNLWNFSGPFTTSFNGSVFTYQGFGVIYYKGPTYTISLPSSITLYMYIKNSTLYFAYKINNISGVFYKAPIGGKFLIGGFALAGVPNDLEFVFGGPGGGSVAEMNIEGTMNLYFLQNGKISLVPYAYSIGFDTAESVVGVQSSANLTNLWKPNVILFAGSDDAIVLWPVKPDITTYEKNNTIYVNMSVYGRPLSNEPVIIEELSINGLKPISQKYTNQSGFAIFPNISSSFYIVYYPGNFTLSSSYVPSSPVLNSIIQNIKSAYDSMVNFLKSYNFKKSLSSFFNGVRSEITYSQPKESINYLILIYILGFSIGLVISAILIRFKL
mgnify:CR=1 FL=1